MSAHWHIGMEVECIKDATRTVDNISLGFPMFKKGEKYTIAAIHFDDRYGVFLEFVECDPRHQGHSAGFRPVQKRTISIEIFRALLNPSPQDRDYIELEDLEHSPMQETFR